MQGRDPQSTNTFATIYCRISDDKTGVAAGVERQESDCRALADRLGLTVTHVLVDNSVSAFSGKPRPQYKRLLELMKNGEIGTVLAFHQDRLQRSPVELEEYVDISEVGQVTTHTVLAGHIDLSTPAGRFNARIIGAAARYEVEHMIERQRAAKLRAARDGKFLGGQRPYGFEPQRVAIRETEAKILRLMADALTAGSSFRTVALELNRQGIRTQHNKLWTAVQVRNVITRPINAGIVLHKGIEYKANTPAIFTADEWNNLAVAIKLNRSKSKHPGRFRKHMLNGLLYCGICGAKLVHKSKQRRDKTYTTMAVCGKTSSQTGEQVGCGGVSRQVDPIIDLVTEAVLYRLDSPELAQQLQTSKTKSPELGELLSKQSALNARVAQMSDDFYINGLLERDEFQRVKLAANAELKSIDEAIERSTRSIILPTISITGDIRTAWENASLEWKRDLLFQIIDRIVILPKPKVKGYYPPRYKNTWWFDWNLVDIKWKV